MCKKMIVKVSRAYMVTLGIASLCFIAFGFVLFHAAWLTRSTASDVSWQQSVLLLLLMGVCSMGLGLYFGQGLIREVLQGDRTEVVLEADGIVITDKHGHRVRLDYGQIDKLCVVTCGNWCGPELRIFTPQGAVRLSRWLSEASVLRDTIVERSGLRKIAGSRSHTEYSRSG